MYLCYCYRFFALVLVCTGVGLLMSALYVFFRDLGYFYEIATFIVWITSPVFLSCGDCARKYTAFFTSQSFSTDY